MSGCSRTQSARPCPFRYPVAGVVAAVICALLIDKVGRKRWYALAFVVAALPLALLATLGAESATQVLVLAGLSYAIVQTITFSLYLYSAELYPTRLRFRHRPWQWLAATRLVQRSNTCWVDHCRIRHPICGCHVCLRSFGGCSGYVAVRNRDQRTCSRRAVAEVLG